MQQIHDLLNRIYLEPEFGRGHFEIGCFNRQGKTFSRFTFNEVTQLPGNKFLFHVFDEDGIGHCIGMDLVRDVYKDGELIWKRKPEPHK